MNNSFNIKLKNQRHKETIITVSPNDTIGQLKAKVGADPDDIWKLDGEALKNDKTISFYNIEKDDVIGTNPKHPGGIYK